MPNPTSEQRIAQLELQVSELQRELKKFIAHHNQFAEKVKQVFQKVADGDHAGNRLLLDYIQGVLISTSAVWRLAVDADLIDKSVLCEHLDLAAQHAEASEVKAFGTTMSFMHRAICKGDDTPPAPPKIEKPHLTLVK